MAQQGTSGTPPERRYDETTDPNNPPRAVMNPRVRAKALYVYVGGIILLFLIVGLAMLVWPAGDRDVARTDMLEPQPVGTTGERLSGERLPGGGRPGSRPGSTAGELEHRGVGESIRGTMPQLFAGEPITRVDELAETPSTELIGRRVELENVEIERQEGAQIWLQDGDTRVPALVHGATPARPGTRVDVGGVIERAPDGTAVLRATRIDIRER